MTGTEVPVPELLCEPFYRDESVTLFHGDCREVLAGLPDGSLDSCVTDPPYELGFMGKGWDGSGIAYDVTVWREVLRVLKPGGHLLAFGGTRTWHRLAVAIEDAGFEVRDSIAWMYGSGFPKSLDVSKAIDKAAGAERLRQEPQSRKKPSVAIVAGGFGADGWAPQVKDAITPAAQQWQGWGTALKPAFEPIVVARKPLIGTVAENVQTHGVGGLNIDGCRLAGEDAERQGDANKSDCHQVAFGKGWQKSGSTPPAGRWPANVILDESQAAELDKQSGVSHSVQSVHRAGAVIGNGHTHGTFIASKDNMGGFDDTGGASRFFYTAKASTHERPRADGVAHPTVKPLDLMQYLIRLVTPPGGTVLEPFAGSGTTLEACIIEGFKCIGIELTAEYLPLIVQRVTKPIEVTLL